MARHAICMIGKAFMCTHQFVLLNCLQLCQALRAVELYLFLCITPSALQELPRPQTSHNWSNSNQSWGGGIPDRIPRQLSLP